MSAWLVSKTHIDAIVTGLLTFGLISDRDADATGKLLWAENHKSINYRHGMKRRTPTYTYSKVEVSIPCLIKQVCCYDYQTREHATYSKSKAHAYMKGLLGEVAHHLVRGQEYDDAPWGIDDGALTHINHTGA